MGGFKNSFKLMNEFVEKGDECIRKKITAKNHKISELLTA